MIHQYDHFFFDVDGVIISSVNYYAELFKDIAVELGADESIPLRYYHERTGVKIEAWMPYLIPYHNHDKILETFWAKNKDAEDLNRFPLINGVKDVFTEIKRQNKSLALISSKNRNSMDAMMQHYELTPFIDFSISGDEVVEFKPDPEGTNKALQFFQADPKTTLFVGDSLHDLGAAKNSGTNFVGVLTGICSEEDWKKENAHWIHSVKDLI